MTTRVRVTVVQKHMPVLIEVIRSDGRVAHTTKLNDTSSYVEEYVHSGQTLRVREMTTEEIFAESAKATQALARQENEGKVVK